MFGRVALTVAAAMLMIGGQPASAGPVQYFDGPDLDYPTGSQRLWPQDCADWDEWDKPARPFRIYGNSYYVGTCGIAVILIDSGDGAVLIDAGPANAAEAVRRTIGHLRSDLAEMGRELGPIRLLLHSHEHFDHVGAMARLQEVTGARVLASPEAALVLEAGQVGADDPQASIHEAFPPVEVDEIVTPGTPITLGGVELMPIATLGHTPGALSWTWESCEGERCVTIVYADSLSPVSADDYRFSDHPEYVQAYREGLERLAALDCDILLTPHPSASGMRDRLLADDLTSGPDCADYAASISARLDARLAEEQQAREAEGTQ